MKTKYIQGTKLVLVFHRSSFEYSRRAENKNTTALENNEPKTHTHQIQQSDMKTGLPHYMQSRMISTANLTGENTSEVENVFPTAR